MFAKDLIIDTRLSNARSNGMGDDGMQVHLPMQIQNPIFIVNVSASAAYTKMWKWNR
jgi:hypothetical protein